MWIKSSSISHYKNVHQERPPSIICPSNIHLHPASSIRLTQIDLCLDIYIYLYVYVSSDHAVFVIKKWMPKGCVWFVIIGLNFIELDNFTVSFISFEYKIRVVIIFSKLKQVTEPTLTHCDHFTYPRETLSSPITLADLTINSSNLIFELAQ